MENDFFLNAPIPPPPSSPSPSSSSIPTWHSLSSPMDAQPCSLLNSSSSHLDSFYNPTWEKSTLDHHHHHHHGLHFDSALTSLVSSPAPSNSNLSNDTFVIRELIGKLGNMNGSGSSSCGSANTSCYSTPLNSPPKLNIPPPLMKSSMALNSTVAEFSADPGFAERAAKFSCFGSRSFNGRSTQIGMNNSNASELAQTQRSAPFMENGKLHRVSSTPSLKALGLGSQMEHKNSISPMNSQDESTISDHNPNAESGVKQPSPDVNSRKRKASSKPKPKESSTSSIPPKAGEANEDSNGKRSKANEGEGHENGDVKAEEEAKGGDEKQNKTNNNSKPPEPPKDYIHVRARRGQATDSHSLAERVRREKISERMKLLQDLVPGCNKVTGKALMLDEIINYVQSLQRQVEFLSMKLASVNTRVDLSIEKDIFQSNNSMGQTGTGTGTGIFPSDSSPQSFYGQNPVIHTNIPNANLTHCSMESLDTALFAFQLPPLNAFHEAASQHPMSFCEDDLHTIVQMGFGQTENRKTPTQSPTFNGSNQLSHMKVEL